MDEMRFGFATLPHLLNEHHQPFDPEAVAQNICCCYGIFANRKHIEPTLDKRKPDFANPRTFNIRTFSSLKFAHPYRKVDPDEFNDSSGPFRCMGHLTDRKNRMAIWQYGLGNMFAAKLDRLIMFTCDENYMKNKMSIAHNKSDLWELCPDSVAFEIITGRLIVWHAPLSRYLIFQPVPMLNPGGHAAAGYGRGAKRAAREKVSIDVRRNIGHARATPEIRSHGLAEHVVLRMYSHRLNDGGVMCKRRLFNRCPRTVPPGVAICRAADGKHRPNPLLVPASSLAAAGPTTRSKLYPSPLLSKIKEPCEDAITQLLDTSYNDETASGLVAAGKIAAEMVVQNHNLELNQRPEFENASPSELQAWAEFEVVLQDSVYCPECGRIMRAGEWFCGNDECENGLTFQSLAELLPEITNEQDQKYLRDLMAEEQGRPTTAYGNSGTNKKLRLAKATAKAAGALVSEHEAQHRVAPAATVAIVSGLATADTLFSAVPNLNELNAEDFVPDPCNGKHTRPTQMAKRRELILSYGRDDVKSHCEAYALVDEYATLCQGQRIGAHFVIKRRCLANGDTEARNYFYDHINIDAEVEAADEHRAQQEQPGDGPTKAQRRSEWMSRQKTFEKPRQPTGRAEELLRTAADALDRRGASNASVLTDAGTGASSSHHRPPYQSEKGQKGHKGQKGKGGKKGKGK